MTSLLTPETRDKALLTVPSHINWSFNGIDFGRIENKKDTAFKFNYNFSVKETTTVDLRLAIRNSLINLHTKSGKPFAICVGGADSEIIAREAAALDIPFEIFFLDIWDINAISRKKVESLSTELNSKCNVLSLSKNIAYNDVLPKNYQLLQAEKPTYLCLPYLLEQISDNFFILGGEGDPQKSGDDYKPFAVNGVYPGLPISFTEVWYKQWALDNNKQCEMYFYSSSPDIVKSYFHHPLMVNENYRLDTRHVVDSLYPSLNFGYKTTNWEDKTGENYDIRMFVRNFNKNNELFFQPRVTLLE